MNRRALKSPGEHLKDILTDRGLSQSDLAFILGRPVAFVNYIINGRRYINASVSKELGIALSLSAEHFANLQIAYDLAMADEPDDTVKDRADLISKYPVREMVKRGWINEPTTEELARFLELNSPDEIPYLAHAAKRTSYEEREIPPEQLVWLFRARQLSRKLVCPKYSAHKLEQAVNEFRTLIIDPEPARHVPRLLFEAGVRFVIIESMPSAKIDGVCFWQDNTSPVIGLSMRFDRIDNFWFVLRHECEHVLRGHGRTQDIVDELDHERSGTGNNVSDEERVANAAAADFCTPSEKLESFIRRKKPFFYEKDVLAFAKLNGIHPGLVVGQLQHKLNRYEYLKKYQVKIRHCVLPGAIVDGWGQSVPIGGMVK